VDEIRAGHVAPDDRLPDLPEHYGPFLRLMVDTAAGTGRSPVQSASCWWI